MSRLSQLSESAVFGGGLTLRASANATLELADERGKAAEYTDLMSAYGAVNFGHTNPAIRPFANAPADIAACFCPPAAERVAEWLCRRLELPEHRVLYQVGGSFAVTTALALAQRRRAGSVLAIQGSFHGLGLDALAASTAHRDLALQDTALLAPLAARVDHLRPGELPRSWSDVSCLIYEPVQGANGYVPLDGDWLRELERQAHARGVVTIADEVQAGFFRHGTLSPSRRLGLSPQILLYSKSLTNGLFPLSAVVYDSALESGYEGTLALAHTFQTSALGFYAAEAVTRFVDEGDVERLAGGVESSLCRRIPDLRELPCVRGLDLTGPTLSVELGPGRAKAFVRRCAERRVLPFTGGERGERVRIAPPLTVPLEQLERALDIVVGVLSGLEDALAGAAP